MRCAATESSPALRRAPRAPAARSSPSASREVSRSSTSSARRPKRPWRRCAKRRASLPTGCSVPSACTGIPTTSRTGRHSATSCPIAANRARFSTAAMAARGCARRVSKSPTATPMRFVPKSKASTVPVLAEFRVSSFEFRVFVSLVGKLLTGNSQLETGVRRGRPARKGWRNRCPAIPWRPGAAPPPSDRRSPRTLPGR